MSFGSDVKSELSEDIKINSCCAMQELSAIFLFSRRFNGEKFSISTENLKLRGHIEYLTFKALKIHADVRSKEISGGVRIEISDRSVLNAVNENIKRISENRDDASQKKCAGCDSAFIRGAFLAGGVIVDPSLRYELEYITNSQSACLLLKKVFEGLGYIPKYTMRRSLHVIYFKSNEEIVDVLNIMGAVNGSISILENVVLKNIKGNINRQINFESANIDKTVESAQKQIEAILKIDRKIGLENLPPKLAETAKLRIKNAQSALSELAALHNPKVSKSGLNHRLNRLIEISEKL